ncbi:sulfotransferase [Marinobacter changyiensis]|uniref:sulfotransferase n=1 Tax=Marinobacter changyiensis TaxID=2604091 RepID=UPI0012647FE2|nr:sulfotransferase [Marinobacter changyiensis]
MRSTLRRWLRDHLIRALVRALDSQEVHHLLNQRHTDDPRIRTGLTYRPTPYRPVSVQKATPTIEPHPIFISGRFRSGSTLLWNLFRRPGVHTAYYEPLNERRWFDTSGRGDHTDLTHRGVDDYWREYDGLEELANFYQERWVRERLYMDGYDFDPALKRYLQILIERAPERPVLQFNRVDFRLPWLRQEFPNATIVHIYRDPREQWCSFLGTGHGYGPDASGSRGYQDRFYLNLWGRDLCRYYPFLTDFHDRHRYYLFYLLWKLSFLHGQQHANYNLAFEDLVTSPKPTLAHLFDAIGVKVDIEPLLPLIEQPRLDNWHDYADDQWFCSIETECDALLNDYFSAS